MLSFDVVLGMDWLSSYQAVIVRGLLYGPRVVTVFISSGTELIELCC